jgi:hypothetical protein
MSTLDEVIGRVKRVVIGVLLKQEVITLLRSPTVAKMNFKYDKFSITGADYADLAHDIALGKVGVLTDKLEDGAGAQYEQLPQHDHPNTLVFPTTWTSIGTSAWRRMSVIHEATHAIQDKRAKNMNEVDAEAPAFFSEALFTLLDGATSNVFDPIKKSDKYDETLVIYRRVWLAAKAFVGPPKQKEVEAWRVEHIDKAVDAHSLYSRRRMYTFDGY